MYGYVRAERNTHGGVTFPLYCQHAKPRGLSRDLKAVRPGPAAGDFTLHLPLSNCCSTPNLARPIPRQPAMPSYYVPSPHGSHHGHQAVPVMYTPSQQSQYLSPQQPYYQDVGHSGGMPYIASHSGSHRSRNSHQQPHYVSHPVVPMRIIED